MKKFSYSAPFGAALFLLGGCAAEHLNSNTIEIAAQVDDVYTKQTLNNLSKFIDDRHAIPSQIILNQGQFQTADSITPSLSVPLTSQIATTITRTAAGLQDVNAHTLSGYGATVQGTINQQQNYTGGPLNDANALRNQKALYMFAVYGDEEPLIKNYHPPKTIFYQNRFIYDPFFLQEPHCVLCLDSMGYDPENKSLDKLFYKNRRLKGGWLIWDSNGATRSDVVFLGNYGRHALFISQKEYREGVLEDFVLFMLPFSNPAVTIAQKGVGTTTIHIDNFPPTSTESEPKKTLPKLERKFAPSVPSGPPATNFMYPPADRQQTVPFPMIPAF